MVLEIDVNADSVKKLEKFLGTGKYKDLVTNTKSFSRKLNEERKMRLPYVCGQVITLMFCADSNYSLFPRLELPRSITTPTREPVRGCPAPALASSTPILKKSGRRRTTSIS